MAALGCGNDTDDGGNTPELHDVFLWLLVDSSWSYKNPGMAWQAHMVQVLGSVMAWLKHMVQVLGSSNGLAQTHGPGPGAQ